MRSFSTLLCTAVIALVFTLGCSSSSSNSLQGTVVTSSKAITAFGFANPPATGTINETAHTIAVILPAGTPVTALVAIFTTTGASVMVGGVVQESAVTQNNFSSPVVYTVTAADGSTQAYTVTISFSTLSSSKAITAYSFTNPPATGIISDTTHAIAVTVPAGTDVTALVATFTIAGASVAVGGTVQVSGVTPNNFTSPVVYTVTAADGTTQNYTVTVTIAPGKAFLTFELAGVSGTINTSTISVVLPPDTVVTALTATFTVSPGASVTIGAVAQTSGVTLNDFSSPVVYTVTASDMTTRSYTVSVALLDSPKLMSAFSFTAVPATGVINQNAKTISVTVPLVAGLNPLVASYVTSTGCIVKVGPVVQTSDVTPNDFTNPVVYTVIAPDGLFVNYTVAVSIRPPTFTSFVFSSVSVTGLITQSPNAVEATVPANTDVTSLVSTFTTTDASLVSVGATTQTSGVTANDFTAPLLYVLTGGTTTEGYSVTVTKAPGVLSLPQTGQKTSYSAADDGMTQRGVVWPIPRFTAAGSVVTDTLTGLQWPQNADTPTFGGCTGGVMNWQSALNYVACLNANNYLAQNDWRLPNTNELVSLLTASVPDVYSWLNNEGFNNMQGNFYFTSSTDPATTSRARIVNMVTGNSIFGAKTDLLNVLPVRGTSSLSARAPLLKTGQTTTYDAVNNADDGALQAGIAWPSPRFTNPGGTTPITGDLVVDQLTGLMWTTDGDTPNSATCPMSGTWEEALAYIACLNTNSYLGYTDWRLPNANDLESLINAEEIDSSSWLNAQGFSNVQGNAYWSSTTYAFATDNAWLVFMADGSRYSTTKTDASGNIKVWPVRSGF